MEARRKQKNAEAMKAFKEGEAACVSAGCVVVVLGTACFPTVRRCPRPASRASGVCSMKTGMFKWSKDPVLAAGHYENAGGSTSPRARVWRE